MNTVKRNRKYETIDDLSFQDSLDTMMDRQWSFGKYILFFVGLILSVAGFFAFCQIFIGLD